MPYPYITRTDLEERLGEETVRRICDDDGDGDGDDDVVTRLCKDASAKVAGYLRGIYPLSEVAQNTPEEVKRLTLDVAEYYAAKRHATYVQKDWRELKAEVEKELKDLRTGTTRLDVEGTPEPAANEGGMTFVVSTQIFDAMITTTTDVVDTLTSAWDKACDELERDLLDVALVAAGAGVAKIKEQHPYQDRTYELTGTSQVALGEFSNEAQMIFPAKNKQGVGYASFVNAMNRSNGHRKNYEFITRGEKAALKVLERESEHAVEKAVKSAKRRGS